MQKSPDLPHQEIKHNGHSPQEATVTESLNVENTHTPYLFTLDYQEKELLRVLVTFGNEETEFSFENDAGENHTHRIVVGDFVLSTIQQENLNFNNPQYAKAFDVLKTNYTQTQQFDAKALVYHSDQEIQQIVVDVLSNPYELSDWKRHFIFPETEELKMEQVVKTPLFSFYLKSIEQRILNLQEQLKDAETDEQISENLSEQIALKETCKVLAKNLNNRVILR